MSHRDSWRTSPEPCPTDCSDSSSCAVPSSLLLNQRQADDRGPVREPFGAGLGRPADPIFGCSPSGCLQPYGNPPRRSPARRSMATMRLSNLRNAPAVPSRLRSRAAPRASTRCSASPPARAGCRIACAGAPNVRTRPCAGFGEGYWRRSHQLPGVLVCPEHLCWLRGARLPKIVGQHDFIAATPSTCPAPAADAGWDTRAVLPGPCLDCPSERVSARRGSSQLDLQRPDRRVSKTHLSPPILRCPPGGCV